MQYVSEKGQVWEISKRQVYSYAVTTSLNADGTEGASVQGKPFASLPACFEATSGEASITAPSLEKLKKRLKMLDK